MCPPAAKKSIGLAAETRWLEMFTRPTKWYPMRVSPFNFCVELLTAADVGIISRRCPDGNPNSDGKLDIAQLPSLPVLVLAFGQVAPFVVESILDLEWRRVAHNCVPIQLVGLTHTHTSKLFLCEWLEEDPNEKKRETVYSWEMSQVYSKLICKTKQPKSWKNRRSVFE